MTYEELTEKKRDSHKKELTRERILRDLKDENTDETYEYAGALFAWEIYILLPALIVTLFWEQGWVFLFMLLPPVFFIYTFVQRTAKYVALKNKGFEILTEELSYYRIERELNLYTFMGNVLANSNKRIGQRRVPIADEVPCFYFEKSGRVPAKTFAYERGNYSMDNAEVEKYYYLVRLAGKKEVLLFYSADLYAPDREIQSIIDECGKGDIPAPPKEEVFH